MRELAERDTEAVYNAYLRSDFTDAMLTDAQRDRYFAEEYIRMALNGYKDGKCLIWAVCDAKSGDCLGCVSLSEPKDRISEIGYWISESNHGKGYATESVCAVLDYAKTQMRLHRVWARCRIDNPASLRVLKKSGFRLEGIARDEVFRHGEYISIAYLAVIYEKNI